MKSSQNNGQAKPKILADADELQADKVADLNKANVQKAGVEQAKALQKQLAADIAATKGIKKTEVNRYGRSVNHSDDHHKCVGLGRPAKPHFLTFFLVSLYMRSTGNATSSTNATAPKNVTKESTKNKKSKDKDQRVADEKRRQQDEEERQQLEERKRLELIAAQRKAKMIDPETVARIDPSAKRNNLAASVGTVATMRRLFFCSN